MPIDCPIQIRVLSDKEFEERDYRVMGHAYVSQNELGRLCDERVYEADLSARLLADGFRVVHTQVPVTLTHRDYAKRYFLDLVADDALYELKTAAALTGEDDAQLIHYILLIGVRRGKLLNFRTRCFHATAALEIGLPLRGLNKRPGGVLIERLRH